MNAHAQRVAMTAAQLAFHVGEPQTAAGRDYCAEACMRAAQTIERRPPKFWATHDYATAVNLVAAYIRDFHVEPGRWCLDKGNDWEVMSRQVK
jgi:hypothetical protein